MLPVVLPLQTHSITSLKLTASSRPTAPLSGSAKCLRFDHWLTLCTLNMYILTYLLTYLPHIAGHLRCLFFVFMFVYHRLRGSAALL